MRHTRAKGLHSVSFKFELGYQWILEVWESREAMLQFRKDGKHQRFAKKVRHLVSRMESHSIETDQMPNWDLVYRSFENKRNSSMTD